MNLTSYGELLLGAKGTYVPLGCCCLPCTSLLQKPTCFVCLLHLLPCGNRSKIDFWVNLKERCLFSFFFKKKKNTNKKQPWHQDLFCLLFDVLVTSAKNSSELWFWCEELLLAFGNTDGCRTWCALENTALAYGEINFSITLKLFCSCSWRGC